MQLGLFLAFMSFVQAAAGSWTAAGVTRGVSLAFRDDPALDVREVRATAELWFPLDATRSRVVYQVAVNPGGRLPGWLVRRGASGALPEVIDQVRRRLERDSR